MFISKKVKAYIIQGENEKEAYLKGCKKLANVIASKKYSNLTFKVERLKKEKYTFVFTIFTTLPIGPMQKMFCKACKEFHCQFYINEEWNCARCNMKAFILKANEATNISKGYYKGELKE